MRQRLTTRVAEDLTVQGRGATKESKGSGIDNDVYDMNDTDHERNDPSREEYAKGDPSAWAEDPNTKNPAADDSKREETGHAPLIDKHKYAGDTEKDAAEAIANVRRLEEKAVRAIVASQRALPGASKKDIEAQSAAFMHMPDDCLNGTLARQEKLAREIAAAAEKSADDAEEAAEAPDEAAAEAPAEAAAEAPAEAEASDDKEAKKEEKEKEELPPFLQKKLASMAMELAQEIVKEAAKKGVSSINTNDPEMNISNASEEEEPKESEAADEETAEKTAGSKKGPGIPDGTGPRGGTDECPMTGDDGKDDEGDGKKEEKEEKKEEKKDDDEMDISFGEDEDEGKDASDDILSQIFSNVTASADKKGASKLSGLVRKQASEGAAADLDSVLMAGTPPDINHLFQQ